ncbi:hypothetical protein [Dehalogenimonas alkenigignens]|uniref:hypothetical protein n=1 Tax=Dehalogenimonas alkenigignens TaxID=1217799 RepID=UPI000D57A4E0|nr:hypothetical protein [Dehalogenimonas alkenigignens]PVV83525.1 hypothetical protein DD509_06760 [Dehalogenimonas alkenigignens]
MAKFIIGDRVKIISGLEYGKVGIIIEVLPRCTSGVVALADIKKTELLQYYMVQIDHNGSVEVFENDIQKVVLSL